MSTRLSLEDEIADLCSLLPQGWKISHHKPRMHKSRPTTSSSTRSVFDLSHCKILTDAPKDVGSKKRKSIVMDKPPRSGPKIRQPSRLSSGIGALPRVTFAPGGLCPKEVILECAEIALSSFNVKSLSQQGPEYELVEALECVRFVQRYIVHCNFIARRKNECEAENELFFAQVEDGEAGALGCCLCCILGRSGTVTGNCGCKSCERYPNLIQHPRQGGFTIKH